MGPYKYSDDRRHVIRPKTPPWLRKTVFGRHRTEFLIGGGIGVALLIILGIVLAIIFLTSKSTKPKNVDPPENIACQNFHEIVRGWNDSDVIRKNGFRKRFRTMIESTVREEQDTTVKEMISLYEFCMDEDSIEKYGLESLKGMIRNMGGWPVMTLRSNNGTCYTKSFCLQSKERENLGLHFISSWVVPCPGNKSYCIELSLDYTKGLEKRCREIQEERTKPVCTNFTNFGQMFSKYYYEPRVLQQSCERLSSLMKVVCDDLSKPRLILGYVGNIPMTFDEYAREIDSSGGLFFNTIPEDVTITNQTLMYLPYPNMVRESIRSTDIMSRIDTLNIAMWNFVNSFKLFIPKYLRQHLSQPVFFEPLEHRGKQDRRRVCMDVILSAYPSTSTMMYRRKYYDSEIRENVERIFNDVKEGFIRILKKMNRPQAREELDGISLFTPEPQKDIFGNLTIDKTDPIQTVLNLKNLELIRNYSYLKETFDLEDEELAKIDKNDPSPRYIEGLKRLYLPVETLHMYFEKGRPDYVNYVSLGFTIARRIVVGFHHQWFEENNQYTQRMNCFIDQFSKCTKHQDKDGALKKIISNHMGFRAAYAAYDISIKRLGNPQSKHPKYNNRQLFWITAGKLFSRDGSVESKIISYLDEFHHDFGCRIGSKMYPNKTCSLIRQY